MEPASVSVDSLSVGLLAAFLAPEGGSSPIQPSARGLPVFPVPIRAPASGAVSSVPGTSRRPPTLVGSLLRSLVVVSVWALAVTLAAQVHPTGWVRGAALLGHLVGLVCGFGAVVALDVYGAACLTGRRSPVEVARLAASLEGLIWGGLLALVTTGALLAPHLDHTLTRVKLAAVLAVGLNGVNARSLRESVAQLHPSTALRELPHGTLWRLFFTAAASQLAWWTCVLIGFRNTPH